MRQDLCALDDHLVGVVVTVVAGLGEDVDGLLGDGAVIFFCNDFAHHLVLCPCDSVQDSLGDAVADSGVEPLAAHLDGFHLSGQLSEAVGFPSDQHGLDVCIDDGDEVLGQEEGISSACSGVLDRCAVAVSDLAVLQHDLHGDGFAGHTDRGEALGHGSAGVEGAVMARSALDRSLVVKIEACSARRADHINDFHYFLLRYMRWNAYITLYILRKA